MSSSKESSAAQSDDENQNKETGSESPENEKEQSPSNQNDQKKDVNSEKPTISLHVGNLKYETDEKRLVEIFSQYGNATARIARRGGRSKGFGFVEMDSQENAQKAIDALNQTDLDGRTITVEFARSNTDDQAKSRDHGRRDRRDSKDRYRRSHGSDRYRDRRDRRDRDDYDDRRRSRYDRERRSYYRRRHDYDYSDSPSPRRRHHDYSD